MKVKIRKRKSSDCATCGWDMSSSHHSVRLYGYTFDMCCKCKAAYEGWKEWNKILAGMAGRKQGKPHQGMEYEQTHSIQG